MEPLSPTAARERRNDPGQPADLSRSEVGGAFAPTPRNMGSLLGFGPPPAAGPGAGGDGEAGSKGGAERTPDPEPTSGGPDSAPTTEPEAGPAASPTAEPAAVGAAPISDEVIGGGAERVDPAAAITPAAPIAGPATSPATPVASPATPTLAGPEAKPSGDTPPGARERPTAVGGEPAAPAQPEAESPRPEAATPAAPSAAGPAAAGPAQATGAGPEAAKPAPEATVSDAETTRALGAAEATAVDAALQSAAVVAEEAPKGDAPADAPADGETEGKAGGGAKGPGGESAAGAADPGAAEGGGSAGGGEAAPLSAAPAAGGGGLGAAAPAERAPSLVEGGGIEGVVAPAGGGPAEAGPAQAGEATETTAEGPDTAAGPVELRLPMDFSAETATAVEAATGRPLPDHMAAVQSRLDGIAARAAAAQAAAIAQSAAVGQQVQAALAADAGALSAQLLGARGALSGAIATGKAGIMAAAAGARAAVAAAEVATQAEIAAATEQGAAEVKALYGQQRARYKNLEPQIFGPYKKLYEEKAAAATTDADKTAETFCDLDIHAAVGARDGTALEKFTGPLRVEFVNGKLEAARSAMKSGGKQRSAALLAQVGPAAEQVKSWIAPLDANVANLSSAGAATVRAARKSAQKKLAVDLKGANSTIDGAEQQSLAELDAMERAISAELDAVEAVVAAELAGRAELTEAITSAAGLEFGGQIDVMLGNLAVQLPDGGVTVEAMEPMLCAAEAQLEGLSSSQLAQLGALLGEMLAAFSAGSAATREGLAFFLSAATQAIDGTVAQKAAGFQTIGVRFAESVQVLGPSVSTTVAQWVQPIGGGLSSQATQIRSLSNTTLGKAKAELKTGHDEYVGQQESVVGGFMAKITPKAIAAGQSAGAAAQDRAKQAFQAMRGMGTDENGLFNALRGMKEGEPAVTKEEFRKIGDGNSLESWMADELSDDEYEIGIAHLHRQHGRAARLEIKYSCHWYGDDKAQMEKVMRGLPEEERKKVANDPEWAETRNTLQSRLTGADLDVAKALIANNVARADAVRLKETIDKARLKKDDDAVHDALEGMDQEQIDAIAKEFATLKGVTKAGTKPLEGMDARTAMAAYVTRDIEAVKGYRGARTMSTESKDLSSALILNGKDSMEVRVTRLERELKRKGGPNDVRMEKALYVNDNIGKEPGDDRAPLSERLHDNDPEVRKVAEAEAKKQQADFAEAYKKKYGKEAAEAIQGNKDAKGDKKQLFGQMLNDGFNSPEVAKQQIKLAVTGAGTDEDAIKRALKGMSPADIKNLKGIYPELESDLGVNGKGGLYTELSGQDRIDVEIMLMGDEAHLNDEQKYGLAERKMKDQLGPRGGMGASMENQALKQNWAELKQFKDQHKADFGPDGAFCGSPADYDRYLLMCKRVGISAELRQASSDRITDYITTGIAVVGAIAATVLTAGAAAPFLVAAATAGATGLATIIVKAEMKGGRYGWEEGMTDLAKTGVEALTAGVGAKIARGAEGLEGMAKLTYLAKTGAVTGGSSAFGTSMLNEATYKDGFDWGGVALNTLGGTLTGAASGAFSGKADMRGEALKGASLRATVGNNMKWGALEGLTTSTIGTLTDKSLYTGDKEAEDILWKVGGGTLLGAGKGATSALADHYNGEDGILTKKMADKVKDDKGVETAKVPEMGAWKGSFAKGGVKGVQSFADKAMETATTKDHWESDTPVSSLFGASSKAGLTSFLTTTAGTRMDQTKSAKDIAKGEDIRAKSMYGAKKGALTGTLGAGSDWMADAVAGNATGSGRANGLDALGLNLATGFAKGGTDGYTGARTAAYEKKRENDAKKAELAKKEAEAKANGQGTTTGDGTAPVTDATLSTEEQSNQQALAKTTPEDQQKLDLAQQELNKVDKAGAEKVVALIKQVDAAQTDPKKLDPTKGPKTEQIKAALTGINTEVNAKVSGLATVEKQAGLEPKAEIKRKKRPNKGTGSSMKKRK